MKPVSHSFQSDIAEEEHVQHMRGVRPTLLDVARQCNLSKASVSKALSLPADKCPVKPATRQRILRVAAEMGYRPNWRAKSLADGRSHAVGLLYSNSFPHLHGIYESMVKSFGVELQRQKFHLNFIPAGEDSDEWRHMLEERRVDGCVVFDWLPDAVKAAFATESLPGVLLNIESDYPMTQVLPDDRGGMEIALEHLLNLGHRRIALFFEAEPTRHHSERHREESFETIMRRAGLRPHIERCTIEELVAMLVNAPDAPTAVLPYTHIEAIKLLPHLVKAGITVPNDLSILTFNDVYPLEYLMPALSTVAIPSEGIGKLGAELLLQQITTPRPPELQRIFLPEHLVLRDSTATPAKS